MEEGQTRPGCRPRERPVKEETVEKRGGVAEEEEEGEEEVEERETQRELVML